MSKTILVTGGSGYVGSVVCRRLIESGYKVINVDKSGHKVKDAINFSYDLENISQLTGLVNLSRPDAIIHLAASTSAPKSVEDPADTYQNNVANSINLAKAAIRAGVEYFIFSSSSSVYGEAFHAGGSSETDLPYPTSPYGKSKFIFEQIMQDFSNAYKFKYVALRYFNAAGTYNDLGYRREPKEHVIPILCERAIKNEKFIIYGDDYSTPDGTCQRDYTHVLDIANGHLAALTYLFGGGTQRVFNLGSGKPTSVKELVKLVETETGSPVSVKYDERREGDPARTMANINAAKKFLSWEPKHSLNDIIKEEMAWAKKHDKHEKQ